MRTGFRQRCYRPEDVIPRLRAAIGTKARSLRAASDALDVFPDDACARQKDGNGSPFKIFIMLNSYFNNTHTL